MSSAIRLLSALWGQVGPGLLLAFALPLLLMALAVVVAETYRRVRAGR